MKDAPTKNTSVDGYWLNMGTLAAEALSDNLHPDLTTRRREMIAEYLGTMMDAAYNMGIRLGELRAQLDKREKPATTSA